MNRILGFPLSYLYSSFSTTMVVIQGLFFIKCPIYIFFLILNVFHIDLLVHLIITSLLTLYLSTSFSSLYSSTIFQKFLFRFSQLDVHIEY